MSDRSVAEAVIATATVLGVFVALATAVKSSSDQREATVVANRAWLKPTGISPAVSELSAGGSFDFNVHYANVGHSPALRMIATALAPVPQPAPPNDGAKIALPFAALSKGPCDEIEPSPSGIAVFPFVGDDSGQTYTMPGAYVTPDVIAGHTDLSVRGCFAYETFAEAHHSSFCYVVVHSGHLSTFNSAEVCIDPLARTD